MERTGFKFQSVRRKYFLKGGKMRKILFLLLIFFSIPSWAALKIDITGAKSEPTPIAIPQFTGADYSQLAEKITDVVRSDLTNSNLFRIIDPDAYIQQFASFYTPPKFQDWQAISAHALLQAEVKEDGNRILISFRLWDVYAEQSMVAKTLTAYADQWRKAAHIISDAIYERITGEKGYFDSKIVFISEKGPVNKRTRRLAVMDQDGANLRFLTDGKDIVMTPRFSPNTKQVVYMSYAKGVPQVYLMNMENGQTQALGHFEGMSFAPRFSPDGKKLVMSLSKNGNSDIYAYDLKSHKRTQLTKHPAIDTSPSYSPDGKNIVFNSDRSGRQHLYTMDTEGNNVKRISFGEGSYATPVWSPRGDYIAFTKIKDGSFYIGVMKPDGSSERLLAEGFLVEGPSWSPNGRLLTFWRQEPMDRSGYQNTKLYRIDITGYYDQEIPTPEDASDPAWSSLLH